MFNEEEVIIGIGDIYTDKGNKGKSQCYIRKRSIKKEINQHEQVVKSENIGIFLAKQAGFQ